MYRERVEDLGPTEAKLLAAEVQAHHDDLAHAQHQNELLAVDLSERICQALIALFVNYPSLTSTARAHLVGAARYFVSSVDEIPDLSACVGLDDDVAVFNQMANDIGRPDLVIAS